MRTAEALNLLTSRLDVVVDREEVPLHCADGRILGSDIVSDCNVPPHDNAAVDGYAVRSEDLLSDRETRLLLTGRIAAGDSPEDPVASGTARRIFTGAPMPAGADTVFMQEDCREEEGFLIAPPGLKSGANRRLAGEDIRSGATILEQGTRLRPQEIGLAASVGLQGLPVFKRLNVALFSTGNEVRDTGEKLPPGCIYDANRYAMRAALERLGCTVNDLGVLPDRFDVIRDTLADAAACHDLLVTSGGVSTGEEDHVRAAIEANGQIHLWRLAIRPGRPIAFGQLGAVPFIGLPGNPVAALVTLMRFARPAILLLSGCRQIEPRSYPVRAGFPIRKKGGRREWIRVRIERESDGLPLARKFPRDGAGILNSMVASDGLCELPEDLTSAEEGHMVDFLPFNELG